MADPRSVHWQQQPQYGPPPFHSAPPPPPRADPSRKFLNVSGGVLALVIAAVVLVCCVGPVATCFFSGLWASILTATQTGTTQPEPTVTVVSCEIDDDAFLPTAEVQWELTNNGTREGYWTVTITVTDANGRQVGDTSDLAFGVAPGATETNRITVFLDAPGGRTCHAEVD